MFDGSIFRKKDSRKDSGNPNSSTNSEFKNRKRFLMFNGGKKSLIENLDHFMEEIKKSLQPSAHPYDSLPDTTGRSNAASSSQEIHVIGEDNDSSNVIARFEPEPFMFRDCKVASVRDFETLAHNLYRALEPEKSPEERTKSPERVYRVLYFLLREDTAIEKLNAAFKRKDEKHRDLETALRDHFKEGTPQLEYALHLISKKNPDTDQPIDQRPESIEERDALLNCIQEALLRRDYEKLYRALTPFQRNTESLCQLNELYKKGNLNTGLQADMKLYLGGDSLGFALFLIGDDGMATKEVKLPEAERLAKVALDQTFERNDGHRVQVAHEYTDEECMYRAHILAEAFKELGYGVQKIFAHSLVTDKHGKINSGFVDPDNQEVSWHFHTACCIPVRIESNKTEIRIVDPSLDPNKRKQLWTVEEWMKWLDRNPGSYELITFEEWQAKVEKKRRKNQNDLESYPVDQTHVFITSRNYTAVPNASIIREALQYDEIPDQYSREEYNQEGKEAMAKATKLMPFFRLNFDLHNEMQYPTIIDDNSAQCFLTTISGNFSKNMKEFRFIENNQNTLFSKFFSNPYQNFMEHLQNKGISSNTIARFKEYLSRDEERSNRANRPVT